MNERPMNRAQRRAEARRGNYSIPDMAKMLDAVLSPEHPLDQRRIWATMLSLWVSHTAEQAAVLMEMVESDHPEHYRDSARSMASQG